MPTGGDPKSLTIAGREFPYATGADPNRNNGGYNNEQQENGNGSSRMIKTRKGWGLLGNQISVDDQQGDMEFLEAVRDGNVNVDMVYTTVDDVSYFGKGQIVGDLAKAEQSTTTTFDVGGPGKFKPLSS